LGVTVTIKDVASAAGVSTATVSRVLSGRRPVSAEVALAVRAASERLGYQANAVARSLRLQSTGTVGMVVPHVSNPFFPAIVEAVERELADDDVQLLLCDSQGSLQHELARTRALLGRRVDGLLLIPCESPGSADAVALASEAVPVVLIDRTAGGAPTDFVGNDDAVGMAAVLDHLVARGARSFAFVSAADRTSSAHARRDLYSQLTGADRALSARAPMLGDFSYEWGRRAAARLLAAGPLPDAVVCGADIIALGLLSALHDSGVTVPDDVLVTGYDDIGFAALSNPGLTTVRQPVEQLGRRAVALLRARIVDPSAPPVQEVLRPELVVRGSSGHVRPAGTSISAAGSPPPRG
jgi:LacI family transcriptional regulator